MQRLRLSPALARTASALTLAACFGSATSAIAQDTAQSPETEIIVTGVRASLDRSIDLKRNAAGVVDGISAEDIGKFPDTNLAESLQRITGVSIDRVNGEGSRVTVRGFGPGLQPRHAQRPRDADREHRLDRPGPERRLRFGHHPLVRLLEHCLGRRELARGLQDRARRGDLGRDRRGDRHRHQSAARRRTGFTGSIGAKAVYDQADTEDYSRVTPEVSGLLNWVNEGGTFGIGLFGSYQVRNNSAPSATTNDWNIETFAQFSDPSRGRVNASTTYANAPSANTLVGFPNDMRYHYSEFHRERINGQLTLQFQPSDAWQITADATYYQNQSEEQRTDQAQWLNRPFSRVEFDGNPDVATAVKITDIISGAKDGGFEQQYRAIEENLLSLGLNFSTTRPTI
jgi:hypothetical protein